MKAIYALLFGLILVAAGCVQVIGPSPAPSGGGGTGIPTIDRFEASPASVAAGGMSTLSWQVSNASMVTIDQGIGGVALSGNRPVSPQATTTYTLVASNAAGSARATAQILVASGPAPSTPSSFNLPVVKLFTVQPANIIMGGSTLLQWDVSNASSVSIDPSIGPVAPQGSTQITPTFATTYKLTATNAQGSILAATLVTVSSVTPSPDIPVILSFSATPYVIRQGEQATLSWQTTNASSVNLDHEIGIVQGSGSMQVSPRTTTIYTLTASNPDGAQLQTAVVNVK